MCLSFLLSGMESGVFALSRLRIRQLMRTGSRSARILNGYLDNSEDFVWAILIGNTLANFTAFALGVLWLENWMGLSRAPAWAILLAAGCLFYALLDLLPKMLFQRFPNRLCLLLARPFRGVELLLWPGVRASAWIARGLLKWGGGNAFTGKLFGNRDELRQFMARGGHALSDEEQGMVQRVLELQHRVARQVMTPLERVLDAAADEPLQAVFERAKGKLVQSVPVWSVEGGVRRVAGVLPLRQLLYDAELDRSSLVRSRLQPALFVEESSKLDEVLRRMQRGGQRLALVNGPNGETVGVLALSDVLHSIFGEVSL